MMKLMCLLFFLATGTMLADQSNAQTVKFSVNLTNVPVSEVLEAIEQKATFHFFYNNSLIDMNRKVSVKAENKDVFAVLDMIFKDTDVRYNVVDQDIILTVNKGNQFQQGTVITGTVTDETGEALPGVNISVQGTTLGTITDANGKYSITVPDADAVLKFSFVGFVTQEFRAGNRTVINIMLSEDLWQIDEVVVVGYGTQKRTNITGSISSIKPDVYKDLSTGVTEILQGRVAGVNVNNGDIIIRGAASINGSGPLWIVDGIPGGAPNFNDIQSIEVLKDGASIAIYGARGAGGVILVTTKRGNPGETRVNFRVNLGVRMPLNIPKMLHTPDFIDRKKAAGYPTLPEWGWDTPASIASLPDTQWNDLIWGNAFEQNYFLQINGGNEKNSYNISADFHDNQNVSILQAMNQGLGFRSVAEQKLHKRLKLTEILKVGSGKNVPRNRGIHYRSVPTQLVYDPENESGGGWGRSPGGYYNGTNLVGDELIYHYDRKSYEYQSHFILDWDIVDGLTFQANLSGNASSYANNRFREAYNYGNLGYPSQFQKEYGSANDLRMFYTLTYENTFAEKHYLKALLGYEASKYHRSSSNGTKDDFPVKVADDIKLGTGYMTAAGDVENRRGLSQFARLHYAYDSKYILEGAIRRDGYDNFGPDNRYGFFPSVSAGWNLHRESFIADNVPLFSLLKLRTSYGLIGNNTIGQFLYESEFNNTNLYYSYDNITVNRGFRYGKVANTSIKWEEVAQFDLGVDAGLLSNRLNFSIEYYTKKTTDMLYWIYLPLSSGAQSDGNTMPRYPANIGEISNKGFDFMIQYRDNYSDFRYDVALTLSTNNNKVIKLNEELNPLIWQGGLAGFSGSIYRTENGHPMGQMWGYAVDGIFQTQSEVDALNARAPRDPDHPNDPGYYQDAGTAPGDFIYHDTNGDGVITDEDKTFIGNPWPKMIYGLNINLSWKGFDVNMGWVGNYRFDIYNGNKAQERNFHSDYNSTYKIYEAWTPDNKNSGHPRVIMDDPNGNFKRHSSYFVEDGSFLKLRTLHIGYNLPASLLGKVKMKGMKLYVNGHNLFTFTKFQGDPEIGGNYLERNMYSPERSPSTKSIVGGVNITF